MQNYIDTFCGADSDRKKNLKQKPGGEPGLRKAAAYITWSMSQ